MEQKIIELLKYAARTAKYKTNPEALIDEIIKLGKDIDEAKLFNYLLEAEQIVKELKQTHHK